MTPELKAKWVEALRSGKFQQGQSMLQTPDGKFCCLGVLCQIEGIGFEEGVDRCYYPSFSAREVFGLSYDTCTTLGNMNDGIGHEAMSFEEIAEYIEREVK